MSSLLAEVMAEMLELISSIDEASILAKRAQADAEEAQAAYHEAGTGTQHPAIKKSEVNARTAAEKAGKTARLLGEAANAFTDYLNVIAPGIVPVRQSTPGAMPTGKDLADEASSQESRLDRFLGEIGDTADDDQEGIATTATNVAGGIQAALRIVFGEHGPHGAVTVTGETNLPDADSKPGTTVGEATSAVLYSALAVAAVVRSISYRLSKRHEDESIGRE